MIVIIGDFVILFGCFVNLDDSIIVIIFVVLGISMLDMFVSKQVVVGEKMVDSLIGNINGSNLVNVFLGLGLFWFMVFIYYMIQVKKQERERERGLYIKLLINY